ncbi:MAG: aminomethyltransferase [Mycobacterium sp.]|jgi:aminomethyltransferase|nr:aminomethyltransferase [Mycobacterium sp.]
MTATTPPVSPLLAEHRVLGAHFTDFAGWQMPLKYASELAEHHAVRSTAGLFDLSHMGEIFVRGAQADALLDYALAGELSKVAVGKAKYSLLCDTAGGVIDDLVVYRLADDEFLLVANASNVAAVSGELADRAKGFDAKVDDQSSRIALLAVQGPKSQDIVTQLAPPEQAALVEELKYYVSTPATVAGIDVLLARTGYTGEDGFELYVPNDQAVRLWQALLVATTERGGTAAGLACRDSLRLEAGMALYGNELTRDTNPFEAGLGRVVKLDKPFVGRDALRQASEAPVGQKLVGLTGAGRRAARAGYSVYGSGEAPAGTVTSGALSPTLGYPIALAYVDVALTEPGTEVGVDIRGTKQPFTVVHPPFYRRS